MKPIIGISPSIIYKSDQEKYLSRIALRERRANYFYLSDSATIPIRRAGGIPIILPLEQDDDVLANVHGLLVMGSEDIPFHLHGSGNALKQDVESTKKIDFDFWLICNAILRRIPILGIGYGMHVMNTCLKGTIYSDLTENRRFQFHGDDQNLIKHMVSLNSNSLIFQIFNKYMLSVESRHRSSIKELGVGLWATSLTDDGLIESIELKKTGTSYFFLGIQWIPEYQMDQQVLWDTLVHHASQRFTK